MTTSKKKTTKKSSKKSTVKKTAKKTSKKTAKKAVGKASKKLFKKKSSKGSSLRRASKKAKSEADSGEDFIHNPLHVKRALLKAMRIHGNEAKRRIAKDMLERYTGHSVEDFQKQVILTNFHYYVERFNTLLDDSYYTQGSAFKASSSKKAQVTIIEFGVGSAMAALIGELMAVIEPKAVLFLGLCGSVHPSLKVGDFVLPIASIRAESVSQHFLPAQVPALPTFKIQKFVSQILVEHGMEYRTGTIHSTDFRFWEFDEKFKMNLIEERVLAVEMETAALFTTCFVSKVSIGALLLVSDCPLKPGGIKTKKSASKVFNRYTDLHIELGIEAMADIAERGENIRHYHW
jgi:AMP nucleosidase